MKDDFFIVPVEGSRNVGNAKSDLCLKGTSSLLFPGIPDEVPISKLNFSNRPLRSNPFDGNSLVASISKKGLLQPILVRFVSSGDYEVIAGNRRLHACKILNWKNIPCHVVEMDDRQAFEASLIENVDRKTLTPMEEAKAYKSYVLDYGWGGVSELSERLGKSVSYVAKRIKLLDLPEEVQLSLENQSISTSVAEELLFIKNKEEQSRLAELVKQRHLTSKYLREEIKENDELHSLPGDYPALEAVRQARKSLDKSITALRIAMNRISTITDRMGDNWIASEILMQHKHMLHAQIDILMKEKAKMNERIYR
jgi:ParB family transcriptional regulator, chromosome partitioning protein